MTWSKLLLNYTSQLTQHLMIGLNSILNNKKLTQLLIMNQTMDIMFGILNTSALPLEKFQLLKFAGCIHANSSIKSTVTSNIITRLARVSHVYA